MQMAIRKHSLRWLGANVTVEIVAHQPCALRRARRHPSATHEQVVDLLNAERHHDDDNGITTISEGSVKGSTVRLFQSETPEHMRKMT
jgi:hypothetical protein